jgi:hypothetical protein
VNENMKDRTSRATARRRLIRGAFAAPAVLTLYSGTAAAAQSILCSAKQNSSPVTPVPGVLTSLSDGYVRYQLWGLVSNTNATTVLRYYVKGADFASMSRPATFRPTSTEWQEFDISSNSAIAGAYTSTEPAETGYTLQKVAQYVVLRIDGSGAVVGVGDGTDGSALGNSCWCSLNPTTC